MKYVQITVDGVTYTLRQNSKGEWTVTNRAPYVSGEYPVTVIAVTENGREITLEVDDPELIKSLTLIVNEGSSISGDRMKNYYPEAIRAILELQAVIKTEGFEVDFLKNDIALTVNEAYLTTMGEERISSWEKALGIVSSTTDSVEDRREVIIARVRGQGKLNTAQINSIVGAFTGGTANSYIKDSVLHVEITPPPENKQYKFTNVVQELSNKVPAHLGITVTRKYATWEEIYKNYANWNTVNQLESWQDLMLWVAPQ